MLAEPVVSVVIIFFNEARFLAEAVDSVLAQTYGGWELLLVDDGSTDASTEIARSYAAQQPGQIIYLEHPGHTNRGMSASRNLGIREARGEFVAFLDADDVWLPRKLEEQVAILESYPQAGMLYGRTKYWYSWASNGDKVHLDYTPNLGAPGGFPIDPPTLLPLYLRGYAAVPCTCSILARRSVVDAIGGFDEAFNKERNLYEDQAFYAKMCLKTPIIAVPNCWDLYRQHPQGSVARAKQADQEIPARVFYLQWLQRYLLEQGVKEPAVWQALTREQWRLRQPAFLPDIIWVQKAARWLKKWLLRLEEHFVPAALSHRLWGVSPR